MKHFILFINFVAMFSTSSLLAQINSVDTLIRIDPKGAYLRLNSDAGALPAQAIVLSDLGLSYGDYIILKRMGDYDNGPHGDTFTGMIGVFSFKDSLLAADQPHRLPFAIDAGEDYTTPNTYYGNLTTDIPEDFFIDSIVVQIPDSGNYLYIGAHDSWFNDNSDPDNDFGVWIEKTQIEAISSFESNRIDNYRLLHNYPNPFNPYTTISFTLPESENVELVIYNQIGKEVVTLFSGTLSAGHHSCRFDAGNLASGIYYYRLQAGGFQEVKKMIILK